MANGKRNVSLCYICTKKIQSLESKNQVALKNELDIVIPGKGIFTETYRSPIIIKQHDLSKDYSGDRYESATIKLLMSPGDYWPFHRLKSKESFKHIKGNDLIIHCLDKNGKYTAVFLGQEHDNAVQELYYKRLIIIVNDFY